MSVNHLIAVGGWVWSGHEMMEIRPRLLIGSMGDALAAVARTPSLTKSHRVTHILSLLTDPPDWSPVREQSGEGLVSLPEGMRGMMFVRVSDHPCSDLLSHFEKCARFIEEGRSAVGEGAVLVHCKCGVSRSATVVIAYIMWSEHLSYGSAFQIVKEQKNDIRPNPGFDHQLRLWGRMNCSLEHKLFKSYHLEHYAHDVKKCKCKHHHKQASLTPETKFSTVSSDSQYKCRKCRKLVFTHENVLVHQLGEGQKAFVRKGKKPTGHSTAVPTATTNPLLLLCKDASHVYDHLAEENACRSNSEAQNPNAPATVADAPPKEKECLSCVGGGGGAVDLLSLSSAPTVCSSLFIEPMEWMGELSETAGKINCPKCGSRLGSFDWPGSQCSCGHWVTPSFKILKSRVDEIPLRNPTSSSTNDNTNISTTLASAKTDNPSLPSNGNPIPNTSLPSNGGEGPNPSGTDNTHLSSNESLIPAAVSDTTQDSTLSAVDS